MKQSTKKFSPVEKKVVLFQKQRDLFAFKYFESRLQAVVLALYTRCRLQAGLRPIYLPCSKPRPVLC